jgi:hypothetical protein
VINKYENFYKIEFQFENIRKSLDTKNKYFCSGSKSIIKGSLRFANIRIRIEVIDSTNFVKKKKKLLIIINVTSCEVSQSYP